MVVVTAKAEDDNPVPLFESSRSSQEENLYLRSIPEMKASIQNGLNLPIEKCFKELDW